MQLVRDTDLANCTFGSFINDGGTKECDVLEPPKDHVIPGRRRLPAGHYAYRLRWSEIHKHAVYGALTGEGTPAPDYEDVEIHPGNTVRNTKACQLPGTERGTLRVDAEGKPSDVGDLLHAVLNSNVALDAFMAARGCPQYKQLDTPEKVEAWIAANPAGASFLLTIVDAPEDSADQESDAA